MIDFSDIARFFYKKRGLLLALSLLFALMGFLLTLAFSSSQFQAQATFHQGQSQVEEGTWQSVLKNLSLTPQSAPAKPMMQSRRLLNEVVTSCGLQIVPIETNKYRTLVLSELHLSSKQPDLLFQNVHYDKEEDTAIFIVPLSPHTFEVWDQKKKSLGKGVLHEPFDFKEGQFILSHLANLEKPLKCRVVSKRKACAALQKKLKVKTARGDPYLLYLTLRHPFRQTALSALDSVMDSFQRYLKKEHEEIAASQVRYLHKRLEQMGRDYDQALQQHVAYLQETMGVEGFLGLAQEIEMLSEPKEKYTAKKHELDLAQKRWQEPKDFLVAAEHPWKEGRGKFDALIWEKEGFDSSLTPDEEFSGLDLDTAHILYTDYTKERDATTTEMARLEAASHALLEPQFEMSALSQYLQDAVSQSLIQKGAEYALALSDKDNRTSKELSRLDESLQRQKRVLHEHVEQKIALLKTRTGLIENKLFSLKRKALALIEKEKKHTEEKLSEIAQKMGSLPEKWRLESRLKLKKELILQIIEGLTQLSEAKVLKRHLYHVESKPLDLADAPLHIQSPHLFLLASFSGFFGGFFAFFVILVKTPIQSFPVSLNYLQEQNFPLLSQEDEVAKIALSIQNAHVIVVVGKPLGEQLVSFMHKMGKTANLQPLTLPFTPRLEGYDHIFIEIPQSAASAEALFSLSLGDFFVLFLKEEKRENLIPFKGRKVLCQLIH